MRLCKRSNEIRHIVQAAKSTPLCLPLAPIIGESRPFVQAVRTTLGQMESSVSDLIAEGRASAAVDALLRFGQSEIDADAVRSCLARSGRTREFFQAVSKAVALRHELEPRPPRPDYLKPI